MQPTVTVGPDRAHPGWAMTLGGAIVVLLAAALAFEPTLAELPVPDFVARFNPVRVSAALGFGLTGAAVLATDPQLRVGWLMAVLGVSQALSMFLEAYGVVGLHEPGSGLELADWALATGTALWAGPYLAIPPLLLLLVPDGRLPGRGWTAAAGLAVAGGVVGGTGWFLLPPQDSDVALHPPGHDPASPTWSAASTLSAVGGGLAVVALLAGVAALVWRFRTAEGVARRQLTWILAGGALTPLLGVAGVVLGAEGAWVAAAATVPLPVAIGVAVGRLGLWDRDGLLARVLVAGVLGAGVLAAYLLAVWALGGLLGEATGAPLVATAAVAIAVVPAHRWAVRWANRLVYGEPEDPAVVLRRLGRRVDTLASGELLDDVCREVAAATRSTGVELVVDDQRVATWGRPGPVGMAVPLHHGGVPLGELRIGADREPGRATMALLRELAPHVAVVVQAAELDRELVRSRARLLAAGDDERARLQRELHDGVGPTLAALAIGLDKGRLLVRTDPDAAVTVLDQLSGQLRETVAAVRGLVADLRPAPLDELGLAGGLRAEARRFAAADVRFEVDAAGVTALPADVELACFRIAAEAMTNVVRHAGATVCRVVLTAEADALTLVVQDDGRGLPEPAPRSGTGLRSMVERAELLGGSLETTAGEGPLGGTTVRVVIPRRVAR